jgi:hypothetical protein
MEKGPLKAIIAQLVKKSLAIYRDTKVNFRVHNSQSTDPELIYSSPGTHF